MKNIQLKIITINLYVATDPIPTRACGVCRFTSFLFRQKNYKNYAFLALEKTAEIPAIVCISGSLWLFVSF